MLMLSDFDGSKIVFHSHISKPKDCKNSGIQAAKTLIQPIYSKLSIQIRSRKWVNKYRWTNFVVCFSIMTYLITYISVYNFLASSSSIPDTGVYWKSKYLREFQSKHIIRFFFYSHETFFYSTVDEINKLILKYILGKLLYYDPT